MAEHSTLSSIAMANLFVCALPFLVITTYTVYSAPVKSRKDEAFLQRWRFLFIRFRPMFYYWSIPFMLRSVFFGLTPVLGATRNPVFCLLVMLAIATAALIGQCLLMPWQANILNALEILLLASVSISVVDLEDSDVVERYSHYMMFGVLIVQMVIISITILQTASLCVRRRGKEYRAPLNKKWAMDLAKDMKLLGNVVAETEAHEQNECMLSLSDCDLKIVSDVVCLLALLFDIPKRQFNTDIAKGRILAQAMGSVRFTLGKRYSERRLTDLERENNALRTVSMVSESDPIPEGKLAISDRV